MTKKTPTSNKCKYYDCGWCYANMSTDEEPRVRTNDVNGACLEPLNCPYNTGGDRGEVIYVH